MRKHFIFHGSVQGVGFRYRAYHAARMYGVTGFVRNLPDGTVEMEAEGSREAIEMTVETISAGSYINIEYAEEKEIPERGDHSFRTS